MPDDRSPHRAALRTLARPETPLFLATIALLLYLGNGPLYEVGSTAVTNSIQSLAYDGIPFPDFTVLDLFLIASPVACGLTLLACGAALCTPRRLRWQLPLAWLAAAAALVGSLSCYLRARCFAGPPDLLLCSDARKLAMLLVPLPPFVAALFVQHRALRKAGAPDLSAPLPHALRAGLVGLAVGASAVLPSWLAGNLVPDDTYNHSSRFPVLAAALLPLALAPAFVALAGAALGPRARLLGLLLLPLLAPSLALGAHSLFARPLGPLPGEIELLTQPWRGTWQGETWRQLHTAALGALLAPGLAAPLLARSIERRVDLLHRALQILVPALLLGGLLLVAAALLHAPAPVHGVSTLPRRWVALAAAGLLLAAAVLRTLGARPDRRPLASALALALLALTLAPLTVGWSASTF